MEEIKVNDVVDKMIDYEVLPDYFVSESDRENYGYSKERFYLLCFAREKQLYDKGIPVYLLYSDNTEKPVAQKEELYDHTGFYGVPKIAWQEFLGTDEGIGFIRACNYATEAASGVVLKIQMDRGEFIDDWFDNIRWGAEIDYESYLDDRYERKWAGVPDNEIVEESDKEYYATMRSHIVGIVAEYAHIIKFLFSDTVYEKISYEEIVLQICERLARDSDNYLFGSRLHKGEEGYEELLPQGYAFEEVYETDETGYVSENESPALQEEVKLRIERKESNGTRRDIR